MVLHFFKFQKQVTPIGVWLRRTLVLLKQMLSSIYYMLGFLKYLLGFKTRINIYRDELNKILTESGLTYQISHPIYSLIVTDYNEGVVSELKNKVETGDFMFDEYEANLSWNTHHVYLMVTEIDNKDFIFCIVFPNDYIYKPICQFYLWSNLKIDKKNLRVLS